VAVALAGWAGLSLWSSTGHELPMLPWSAPGVVLLLSVAVLVMGWPVRRWTRGTRAAPLDPLRAARTVVLAKAAQWAGALLAGWYVAQVLTVLPTLDVEPRRGVLLRAAVSGGSSLVLWLVGALVERWCRVDRRRDDDGNAPGSSAAPR
jgi:hypothetical protein